MHNTTTTRSVSISEEEFENFFTATFDTSIFSKKDFETILREYQNLPFKNSKKALLFLVELRNRISQEESLLELLEYYQLCEKLKLDLSVKCEDRWVVIFKNFVNDPDNNSQTRNELITMIRQGKRPFALPRAVGEVMSNSKRIFKNIVCI